MTIFNDCQKFFQMLNSICIQSGTFCTAHIALPHLTNFYSIYMLSIEILWCNFLWMIEADNSPSHEIENNTHLLFRILKIHSTSITLIIEHFWLRTSVPLPCWKAIAVYLLVVPPTLLTRSTLLTKDQYHRIIE